MQRNRDSFLLSHWNLPCKVSVVTPAVSVPAHAVSRCVSRYLPGHRIVVIGNTMKPTRISFIKKPVGRPRTGIGPLIGVRLSPDMQAQLDAWRARQADAPSRPEAIRRLLSKALGKEKR